MSALLLAACTAPAPVPADAETWLVTLHGRPLGLESRWREGDTAHRRRTLSVLADGVAHELRSEWTVHLDPEGRADRWQVRDAKRLRAGGGRAWIPEVVPPPEPGTLPVLDPDRLEVVDVLVERDGDELRWPTPAGTARVRLDPEGRPVRAARAGVVAERVAEPVEIEPLDVARVLSVPAPSFPKARGALVGEYLVGGAPVRIDAPTWAELPPERETVRRLAREVADALEARAVPEATSGPEALALGRGDCTEHAQALVTRLAEEGLPARIVAGRLYVEDEHGARLVMHAWTEVELGGRWIPVDAALRQVPADAAHLPLGADVADLAATDGDEILVLRLE